MAEVSRYLSPGKAAVIAEIDEEWITPLDARMEPLGGIVFRRSRGEFIDAQVEREIAAAKAEHAKLETEYSEAGAEAKAKLKAKLDAAQNRLRARRDLLKEKIEAIKRQNEAKVKALQEQAAQAKGAMKARLDKRIAEERGDHQLRMEKLSKAWQLSKKRRQSEPTLTHTKGEQSDASTSDHVDCGRRNGALLAGSAVAQDAKKPDGTVKLTEGSVAAGIGWRWGKGVLTYKGKTYPFKVDGLTVGEVGVTKAEATGNVFSLKNVEDFSGIFWPRAQGARRSRASRPRRSRTTRAW